MGRGRQKAKQTKVARELKYFSPETDYDSLQRELSKSGSNHVEPPADDDEYEAGQDERDEYADWSAERRR